MAWGKDEHDPYDEADEYEFLSHNYKPFSRTHNRIDLDHGESVLQSEDFDDDTATGHDEPLRAFDVVPGDSPLIKPLKPFERTFGVWFLWHVVRPPLDYNLMELGFKALYDVSKKIRNQDKDSDNLFIGLIRRISTEHQETTVDPLPYFKESIWDSIIRRVKRAWLRTYEFEGFEPTTGEITYVNRATADGERTAPGPEAPIEGAALSFWFLITSFFALPNRPEAVIIGDGQAWPNLTKWRIFKNFFGGVDVADDTCAEKKWTQIVFSPILLSIAAFKVVTWPLNFTINIGKFFTEFLSLLSDLFVVPIILVALYVCIFMPVGITGGIGYGLYTLVDGSLFPSMIELFKLRGFQAKILGCLIALYTLVASAIMISMFLTVAACVIVGISAILLTITASRIFLIIARAVTSPLKCAKEALAIGRNLKGTIFGFRVGNMLGVFLMLASISITIVAWSIFAPIIISVALPLITALSQVSVIAAALAAISHLPWVVASLAWLSHLPALLVSLAGIKVALVTASTAFGAALAPVTLAISGLIGVSVSTTMIAAGALIGLIGAPVLMGLSFSVNYLSYRWHRWHVGGPVTWLVVNIPTLLGFSSNDKSTTENLKNLNDEPAAVAVAKNVKSTHAGVEVQPRPGTQHLVDEKLTADSAVDKGVDSAQGSYTKSLTDFWELLCGTDMPADEDDFDADANDDDTIQLNYD